MGDGERVAEPLTSEAWLRIRGGGAGDAGSSAIGERPQDSDTALLGEQSLTANDLKPGTWNLTPTPVFWRRPT